MCKMQLCPMLFAANTSSLFLAVIDTRMIFPSLHHQPGQALLQGMRRWMSFLEGKNVVALHLAALPGFSLANAQISLAGTVRSLRYCRDKCAGQHLPLLCEGGRSSQQLLGSGSTSAALREKRVFSAALQEADLSKYQLRLPYSCTNSAVLSCWKLLPSPLRACCFAELAVGRPPPWCSASTSGSDLQR